MPAPKGSKNARGNKGGGRKSEFRERMIAQVKGFALLGLTEQEMADHLGISLSTFENWKKTRVKFSKALYEGKEGADSKVVAALYKRALGYKVQEVSYEKVKEGEFNKEDGDQIVAAEYKKKVTLKEVPPDPNAARYILNNRQKKHWKERQEIGFDPDTTTGFEIHIGKKKVTPNTKK